MSTGSDEPTHGSEYPPLEDAPPTDPHAPVEYPIDGPPPTYATPPWSQQPGYPPPGYPQSSYAPQGYPPPGMPPQGYPPQGYPPQGYPPQYAGGYGYAYDPYAQPRQDGTNGKAIASLVTSLLGLTCCFIPGVVGIILGVIAMREIKQTGQSGHGMALAGVIIGALTIALAVVGIAFLLLFGSLDTHPSLSTY